MACKVIEILRAIPDDLTGGGSCVNYDLTLAFVECYRKMVKKVCVRQRTNVFTDRQLN